jgi:hypothetical protein
MSPRPPSRRRPRPFPRARLAVRRLEDRLAPATFNIANGDIAGFIAAINTCNTNNQADTINLAAGGTYTFADDVNNTGNALPAVNADGNSAASSAANTVTIDGRGAVLQRSAAGTTPLFRFFQVNLLSLGFGSFAVAKLVLNNVTVQGGQVNGSGGALLLNGGNATLSNCTFAGNRASGNAGSGGAVFATTPFNSPTPRLDINLCTFRDNRADVSGGAMSTSVTTDVRSSTFESNVAQASGGAVEVAGNTTAITGSTISGNQTVTGPGGGLMATLGTLQLTNSTVSGNRAAAGGGIATTSSILGGGAVDLRHSTVVRNAVSATAGNGGGIGSRPGFPAGTVTVAHSILAENGFEPGVTGVTGPDVSGAVTTQGYNLVGNGSGATGIVNGVRGDQVGTAAAPINPLLGPLQNNGGPTLTHALLPGSPAIDAGDPNVSGSPPTDQRGTGFPRILNNRIVTVTFSGPVTFAGSPAAAFQLTRQGPGTPTGDVTLAVDLTGSTATQTVARLTFSGTLTQSGSLNDGNYQLTVLSAQVTRNGQALDGDNNGTPGGNYVLAPSAGLYRLYGDNNGDRRVDNADFFQFRTTFGRGTSETGYLALFDFNGDGRVDNTDFFQFRTRLGTSI